MNPEDEINKSSEITRPTGVVNSEVINSTLSSWNGDVAGYEKVVQVVGNIFDLFSTQNGQIIDFSGVAAQIMQGIALEGRNNPNYKDIIDKLSSPVEKTVRKQFEEMALSGDEQGQSALISNEVSRVLGNYNLSQYSDVLFQDVKRISTEKLEKDEVKPKPAAAPIAQPVQQQEEEEDKDREKEKKEDSKSKEKEKAEEGEDPNEKLENTGKNEFEDDIRLEKKKAGETEKGEESGEKNPYDPDDVKYRNQNKERGGEVSPEANQGENLDKPSEGKSSQQKPSEASSEASSDQSNQGQGDGKSSTSTKDRTPEKPQGQNESSPGQTNKPSQGSTGNEIPNKGNQPPGNSTIEGRTPGKTGTPSPEIPSSSKPPSGNLAPGRGGIKRLSSDPLSGAKPSISPKGRLELPKITPLKNGQTGAKIPGGGSILPDKFKKIKQIGAIKDPVGAAKQYAKDAAGEAAKKAAQQTAKVAAKLASQAAQAGLRLAGSAIQAIVAFLAPLAPVIAIIALIIALILGILFIIVAFACPGINTFAAKSSEIVGADKLAFNDKLDERCRSENKNPCGPGSGSVGGNGSTDSGVGTSGIPCLYVPRTGKSADPEARAFARAVGSCGVEAPCGDIKTAYSGTNPDSGYFGRYQWGTGVGGAVVSWPDYVSSTGNSGPSTLDLMTKSIFGDTSAYAAQDKIFIECISGAPGFKCDMYYDLLPALKAGDFNRAKAVMQAQRSVNNWEAMGSKADLIIERYKALLPEEKSGKCGTSQGTVVSNPTDKISKNDDKESLNLFAFNPFGSVEVRAASDLAFDSWLPPGNSFNIDRDSDFRSTRQFVKLDEDSGGVDFTLAAPGKSYEESRNTPIVSHLAGEVTYVANREARLKVRSYGTIVAVYYPSINRTIAYAHLESSNVKVGDSVSPGSLLGRQGSSGTLDDYVHVDFRVFEGKVSSAEDSNLIIDFTKSGAVEEYSKIFSDILLYYNANSDKIIANNFSATATLASNTSTSSSNPCPTTGSISSAVGVGSATLLEEARRRATGKPALGKCYDSEVGVASYINNVGFAGIKPGEFLTQPMVGDQGCAVGFAEHYNYNNGEFAKKQGIVNLLDSNPNLSPYNAPAGSIVVVTAGSPGTAHPYCGDIAVADGAGKFYNDGEMSYGGPELWNGSKAGSGRVLGIYVPATGVNALPKQTV